MSNANEGAQEAELAPRLPSACLSTKISASASRVLFRVRVRLFVICYLCVCCVCCPCGYFVSCEYLVWLYSTRPIPPRAGYNGLLPLCPLPFLLYLFRAVLSRAFRPKLLTFSTLNTQHLTKFRLPDYFDVLYRNVCHRVSERERLHDLKRPRLLQ